MADPGQDLEHDAAAAQPDPLNDKVTEDIQEKDDPATTAARENLKHATISDKEPPEPAERTKDIEQKDASEGKMVKKNAVTEPEKAATPEPVELTSEQNEEMKDHISSPKKKRGREQYDESRDVEEGEKGDDEAVHLNGSAAQGGRTSTGPERKRHRDASEEISTAAEPASGSKPEEKMTLETASTDAKSKDSEKPTETSSTPIFGSSVKSPPQTSAEAFAKSGFGALAASSTSPFGALGASKPSVFGSGATASSGFGALAAKKPSAEETTAPTSGFGALGQSSNSGFGSGFGATSKNGFASAGTGFGSSFGGALGSPFAAGGAKPLSSFAASKPDIVGTEKAAKPFGAPESEDEEDEEEEEEERDTNAGDEDEEKVPAEDKKKPKLTKVVVHDGEEDEATLLQFRAKLFALESKEAGWKERGVGTLKVNAHKSCVEYDEYTGQPIPGSFDPSLSHNEDGKDEPVLAARIIMRQENTHRVILNTLIIKAMKFEQKAAASSIQVSFTALHEGKPLNVILRMTEANSRLFLSEIASIQSELP